MQYGIYETILTAKNVILTKIFHPKARLIRYPSYFRNAKNISFGRGFTCGYRCRIECIEHDGKLGTITFGTNVKIGDNVHVASASNVTFEDDVLLASNIFISDLDHGSYAGDIQSSPVELPDDRILLSEPVYIGKRAWLGENVVVLKGVTIGEGSIIGANTLVNKDVPKNTIAVGNPMRLIKRFNDDTKKWEKI